MTPEVNASTRALVVGLGKSGLSAVRYLRRLGATVTVADTREDPPGLAELRRAHGEVPVRLGAFSESLLDDAGIVVLSPGLAPRGAFFDRLRERGLPLVGDVELFARAARAPVAAVTGTNGKSTVTTLLGLMAERAGLRVRVGGNLGTPALDLLDEGAGLYVLELSSYQLESTESLRLRVGVLLNITPDHLDRYAGIDDYAAAKARIFRHCDVAVVNADDPRVLQLVPPGLRQLRFSLREGAGADYGLLRKDGEEWLAKASEALLPLRELRIGGRHNAANALAALAAGEALGLPRAAMLEVLREFAGLPHRAQWVADIDGVRYINDSKGTNVGSTLAAVEGMDGPLLLIAGGDGKGQDFSPLARSFRGKVRISLLIGRDAARLEQALGCACPTERCASLEQAVQRAAALARPGDTVLLSPACASLDMFRDYAERGARFAAAVEALAS